METGQHVLHMVNEDCGRFLDRVEAGPHTFRVRMPQCMLYPADYRLVFFVGTNDGRVELDHVKDVAAFTVVQSGVTKRTGRLSMHRDAVYYAPTEWEEVR